MKKVNLRILTITLLSILLISSISLYFLKNNHAPKIVSNSNTLNNSPLQKAYDSHRLSACAEWKASNIGDIEKEHASSSPTIDGYKSMVDCSYAENSYYPEKKDEYFVIKDTNKSLSFYVMDGRKHILGSLNIIGVKDDFLFYNFCYEGCSALEYVRLNTNYDYGSSTYQVYPEKIDVLYRQGLPRESGMVINKNRVFFVSLHNIFELNTNDFSIKKIKTIDRDTIFGIYSGMDGSFVPEFEKKDNGILFKIYKDTKGDNAIENKSINSYFLGI
jgi:hypothetical protein